MMNFVRRDIGTLLQESKSQSTETDVQYFQQFLKEIEGIDVPMKDLSQDQLIKTMATFFTGVKF